MMCIYSYMLHHKWPKFLSLGYHGVGRLYDSLTQGWTRSGYAMHNYSYDNLIHVTKQLANNSEQLKF